MELIYSLAMPGMQRVVYAKSLKVLTATSCCLLLIATNRTKLDETTLNYVVSSAFR